MDAATLRAEHRLDEEAFRLFALDEMVKALRAEPEYEDNGRTGLTLIKTPHLRVVLEAAKGGERIGQHVVAGPTLVQVLEGSIHASSEGETRIAHAGEMIAIPDARRRELRADGDAAFLWVLSLD